jgi:polar amino acid transport system substrate-binding protein
MGVLSYLSRVAVVSTGIALAASVAPASAQDSSLWSKIEKSGELVCGAMPAYPIVSYSVSGPAKYEGYAADFCRAMAEALSADMKKPIKIVWTETSWATLVLDLQSGRMDIWPGMSATEQRKKALDMSESLYELAECTLHRKGFDGFPTWAGYNKPSVRFAIVSGTTEEKVTKELAPQADISVFKQASEAILSVQSGRADVMTLTVATCLNTMKTNPNIFGSYRVPEPVRTEPSAVGMRKDGDGRLLKWVNDWATKARDGGRVRSIMMGAMEKAQFDLSNIPASLKF